MEVKGFNKKRFSMKIRLLHCPVKDTVLNFETPLILKFEDSKFDRGIHLPAL